MVLPAETLLGKIFEHETSYWSCISSIERRDGWTAVSNTRLIPRIDPNHAGEFRAAGRPSADIARDIIEFYRSVGAVPAAYVDLLGTPEDLILELERADFQEWAGAQADLMLYVGPDVAPPSAALVEVVATDAAREDWASIADDETNRDLSSRALVRDLYVTQVSDARMTAYLARVGGRPAGRCELFSSAGLGRVEAVRTATAYQRRGLAAACIRQALRDSLRQNAITYVYAEPESEAQRLYHRLGFRTVAHNAMRGFLWRGAAG